MSHTNQDFVLYCQIRAIADLVFIILTQHGGGSTAGSSSLWLEDRRKEGVNPFYFQTDHGLFLEMYYGLPSTIHTPWGIWGFGGSGSGRMEPIVNALLIALAPVSVQMPKKVNNWGEFGPIYSVKGPGLHRKQADYIPYEAAHVLWDEMTSHYATGERASSAGV